MEEFGEAERPSRSTTRAKAGADASSSATIRPRAPPPPAMTQAAKARVTPVVIGLKKPDRAASGRQLSTFPPRKPPFRFRPFPAGRPCAHVGHRDRLRRFREAGIPCVRRRVAVAPRAEVGPLPESRPSASRPFRPQRQAFRPLESGHSRSKPVSLCRVTCGHSSEKLYLSRTENRYGQRVIARRMRALCHRRG
jgi:hypothetical protein